MFYRVENGNLIQAPEKNIKLFIANPTDDQYRFLGYTDNIVESLPEMDDEKEYEVYYEQVDDVKNKIKDNDKLQDLKKKYDNGTEIVKNQLASFPKNVEDDSELKDFDDIVIDDSNKDDDDSENAEESVNDLNNAEKDDTDAASTSEKPQA